MKKAFLTLFIGIISLSQLRAEEEVYPVAILGGGVGALTSAVYLGRAGITPLVIEGMSRGGAIAQSPHVQNWPGEIEISGLDLIEKIHAQAEYNGTHFLPEEVISVDFQNRPFTIMTRDIYDHGKMRKIQANSVIIATGSKPNFLGIPGENQYWTKGVYNCAICDGALYKNQVIAIVGGGDAAVLEAEHLSNIGKKVYILVRKDSFRAHEERRLQQLLSKPNVEVLFQTTVQEIRGDGNRVTQLLIERRGQRQTLDVAALFLAIGATPNSQLFQGQVEMDAQGYILLKNDQETSVKGVFAIGDIVDPVYKQAIIAAGQGATASCQVVQVLDKNMMESAPVSPPVVAKEPPAALTPPVTSAPPSTSIWSHTKGPGASKNEVIEIHSSEHLRKELKNNSTPVLIDFYATWCGPCRNLAPIFDGWAKEHGNKMRFMKVNVDKNDELVNKYGISSMPTMIVLDKDGKQIAKKVGSREISQYVQQMTANTK